MKQLNVDEKVVFDQRSGDNMSATGDVSKKLDNDERSLGRGSKRDLSKVKKYAKSLRNIEIGDETTNKRDLSKAKKYAKSFRNLNVGKSKDLGSFLDMKSRSDHVPKSGSATVAGDIVAKKRSSDGNKKSRQGKIGKNSDRSIKGGRPRVKAESREEVDSEEEWKKITKKQEAYNFWKHLGCPSKMVMLEKLKTESTSVTPEDVELLPWISGNYFLDLPKIMDWLDEIETLTPPKSEKKVKNKLKNEHLDDEREEETEEQKNENENSKEKTKEKKIEKGSVKGKKKKDGSIKKTDNLDKSKGKNKLKKKDADKSTEKEKEKEEKGEDEEKKKKSKNLKKKKDKDQDKAKVKDKDKDEENDMDKSKSKVKKKTKVKDKDSSKKDEIKDTEKKKKKKVGGSKLDPAAMKRSNSLPALAHKSILKAQSSRSLSSSYHSGGKVAPRKKKDALSSSYHGKTAASSKDICSLYHVGPAASSNYKKKKDDSDNSKNKLERRGSIRGHIQKEGDNNGLHDVLEVSERSDTSNRDENKTSASDDSDSVSVSYIPAEKSLEQSTVQRRPMRRRSMGTFTPAYEQPSDLLSPPSAPSEGSPGNIRSERLLGRRRDSLVLSSMHSERAIGNPRDMMSSSSMRSERTLVKSRDMYASGSVRSERTLSSPMEMYSPKKKSNTIKGDLSLLYGKSPSAQKSNDKMNKANNLLTTGNNEVSSSEDECPLISKKAKYKTLMAPSLTSFSKEAKGGKVETGKNGMDSSTSSHRNSGGQTVNESRVRQRILIDETNIPTYNASSGESDIDSDDSDSDDSVLEDYEGTEVERSDSDSSGVSVACDSDSEDEKMWSPMSNRTITT